MFLVAEKSKKKKFNFYLFLFILLSYSKISIREKKVFKRQVVVLKSPFHYKLPKHHLMYNFYVTVCSCVVQTKYVEALVQSTTSIFFLINISKTQVVTPTKLVLSDLLL